MLAETCRKCGQEVRHGVRDGQRGWWHREAADHNPLFGRPMSAVDFAEVERQYRQERVNEKGESYSAASVDRAKMKSAQQQDEDETEFDVDLHDIPAPEVTSTVIEATDERVSQGARIIINLAAKNGWTTRITYSRGPRVHASLGTLLDISDYVQVRMQLDGSDRRAVGSWTNGKFSFGYTFVADEEAKQHRQITRVNSDTLKSWIKGE